MSDAATQAEAQAAALAAARESTITLWTLYAFGVLVTVLRTYARGVAVGFTKLKGDDYLAWVALVSVANCSDPPSLLRILTPDR